jgi:hypothetical protein
MATKKMVGRNLFSSYSLLLLLFDPVTSMDKNEELGLATLLQTSI